MAAACCPATSPGPRRTGVAVHGVVAGLGGRPITRRGMESVLGAAARGELEPLSFLDLDHDVVERERARMAAYRRSGPAAPATCAAAAAVGHRRRGAP